MNGKVKYIARHDAPKRIWHWSNIITAALLSLTGLILFVPTIGHWLGWDLIQFARLLHRIYAVIFIGVLLISFIIRPSNFINSFRHIFSRWDEDDIEFMKKFFVYLANPRKVHLPKQGFIKSGQRISDLSMYAIIFGCIISGLFLWIGTPTLPVGFFAFCLFIHDLCFFGFAILICIHIFLGAGIVPSYTSRAANWMLGNGYIRESDALYHYGHWAEDELRVGINVVEVPDGMAPKQVIRRYELEDMTEEEIAEVKREQAVTRGDALRKLGYTHHASDID